jgi:hypothetical protein
MKLATKIVLALGVGGAVALALALYFKGKDSAWRSGPGISVEFEPLDPSADLQRTRAIVERRLEGRHAVVSAEGKRIIVWIPYPEPRQAAREELLKQMLELRKVQPTPAKIDALVLLPTAERAEEMKRMAPPGSTLEEPLQKLAEASDALTAAERLAATRPKDSPAAQQAIAEARDALRKARILFFENVLTPESLLRMLAAADSSPDAAKLVKELPARYPAQATEILHIIAARDAWRALGGGNAEQGQLEPEEVQRLAEARGDVEFRVAVTAGEMSLTELNAAADELWKRGPFTKPVPVGGADAIWVEALPGGNLNPEIVQGSFEGDLYILCFADPDHVLTHRDATRGAWVLTVDRPSLDPNGGGMMLPFRLDSKGAGYMGDLTQMNLKHPLAIICDGRVRSAPTIQAKISDAGVIALGMPTARHPGAAMREEAMELYTTLNAGSLPTRLKRVK